MGRELCCCLACEVLGSILEAGAREEDDGVETRFLRY